MERAGCVHNIVNMMAIDKCILISRESKEATRSGETCVKSEDLCGNGYVPLKFQLEPATAVVLVSHALQGLRS